MPHILYTICNYNIYIFRCCVPDGRPSYTFHMYSICTYRVVLHYNIPHVFFSKSGSNLIDFDGKKWADLTCRVILKATVRFDKVCVIL
jgi:hypothetical protein